MQIKIVTRIYDDNGTECKEGDLVMVQTENMEEPGLAVIKDIHTTMVILLFEDHYIANGPVTLRQNDFTLFKKSKR